ncbi:hypothetical protein [Arthrobacter sp. ISL-30]|uniref:hypothetical protein n=1 Tax=Arthrobacter sp. ISL-30 TaxID=2819109 RepID=UPI001BE5A696|nr:hypothetical protein [Arthrobacter sp. ISL-30]MBT2513762.1 hypothetical protein [Arthrobacter sp. ISL-30]
MIKGANGPDRLVEDYLQALIDGDAEAALRISDPNIPEEERPLLSNAVYAKAGKRIDGFSLLSTTVTGDSAIVRAELRQSGRKTEVVYGLAKVDPELLDDRWRLTADASQPVTLTVDTAVEAVRVNGVEVPVTDAPDAYSRKSTLTLAAFPGEYTLALGVQEKYLAAVEAKAFVTIGTGKQAPDGAGLKTEASEALRAEVAQHVDVALAGCAASDKLSPENCPFSVYAFGDVRGVSWSVTRKPTYELLRSSDGGWRLSGGASGLAAVNYERNASWNKDKPDWKPDSDSDEFQLRGAVSIEGGKVIVELSRY